MLADQSNTAPPLPSDPSDWSFVVFKGQRIYNHKTIRTRYTAYDLRRQEDLLRIHGSRSNIMVINPDYLLARASGRISECAVPAFRYGRVLKICHANVIYVGPGNQDLTPRRLDFLLVRWYEQTGGSQGSDGVDTLSFPDVSSPCAFGFLDPALVCRGCHIIPRFSQGRHTRDKRSPLAHDDEDYKEYFFNRWGTLIPAG
jgi:hypothetical protein